MTSPQKIIIDTDPGQDIDDLLAIHFACLRPELDIQAITTVTWPTDKRARLVKRLLRYLGREKIPVSAGINLPFRRMEEKELQSQYDLSRTMNHYAFAQPEDPRDEPDSDNAVDLIIRTVDRSPGEVVLACIAPLTNIAAALQQRPDLKSKVKYIAMMGGETALNRIEHNVAFDYVAAEIVLTSGIPVFMGTWDITRRFFLSMKECERFHAHSAEVSRALGKAIDLWHPAQNWKPGPVMYDLFPIVGAFDRSFYTTQKMPVRVETRGEWTRGLTICQGEATHIEVTTGIREEALRELYFETVFR